MVHGVLAFVLVIAAAADGDPVSLIERAQQKREAGDLEGALVDLEHAYRLDPAPALLNNIGFLLERLGRYREAHAAYLQVVEHPNTPSDLRALDRERIAALAPKIDSAWLEVVAPDGAAVYVDGERWTHAEEGRASPGEHVLEIVEGERVHVRRAYLTVGRLETSSVEPSEPLVEWEIACGDAIEGVRVDRHPLTPRLGARVTVAVPAGEHEVELICASGRQRWDERWYAGRHELRLVVVAPPPREPEVSSSSSSWLPWVLVGAGVAATAGGAALLVSAGGDRSTLDASIGADGTVTDLTYPEAMSLESAANTKSVVGVSFLGAAVAAVAVAAVVWVGG